MRRHQTTSEIKGFSVFIRSLALRGGRTDVFRCRLDELELYTLRFPQTMTVSLCCAPNKHRDEREAILIDINLTL